MVPFKDRMISLKQFDKRTPGENLRSITPGNDTDEKN